MPKVNLNKLKKVKSHTFYDHKYNIKVRYLPPDRKGQCDNPYKKQKTISIDPRQDSEKDLLKVLIDESLHAFDFKIENSAIDRIAEDMAQFLIRAGFGLKD